MIIKILEGTKNLICFDKTIGLKLERDQKQRGLVL